MWKADAGRQTQALGLTLDTVQTWLPQGRKTISARSFLITDFRAPIRRFRYCEKTHKAGARSRIAGPIPGAVRAMFEVQRDCRVARTLPHNPERLFPAFIGIDVNSHTP